MSYPPVEDVIRHKGEWYVLATSSRADDRTRSLKHGETFALFDRFGDVQHVGSGDQGLYHEGTRFLSHYELALNRRRPMLLHSTVKEDNSLLIVDLTNPDLWENERLILPQGTLHILRSKVLCESVQYEHVHVRHYGDTLATIELEVRFAADFADIFEVRGVRRPRRGQPLQARVSESEVVLGYEGLDAIVRSTRVSFSVVPDQVSETHARFDLRLSPRQAIDLRITVACEAGANPPIIVDYGRAVAATSSAVRAAREETCGVFTSNEQLNDWINRSWADLQMLISETPQGPYPYAGVPWFSTPFDRDAIITALQVSLDSAASRKRRTGVPRGQSGYRNHFRTRCRTRQDPARDPPG